MTIYKNRFVVDTNIIISQLFWPSSVPGRAFRKALSIGKILVSEDVLEELITVLSREKFNPYLTIEERQDFFHQLSFIVDVIPHVISIKACRDPKDDKFLSLAISGRADILLTGDKDLLVLNPYKTVRILTCLEYLQEDSLLENRKEQLLLRQRS